MTNYLRSLPMDKSLVIEINNVYLKSDRRNQIFKNLDFKLMQGRSAVVYGPPGSGKTSLINLLLGLQKPSSGSVELFGENIGRSSKMKLNKIRRKIGGIGGMFELIPSLTVAENIAYPLVITGERSKIRKERLLKMLTEFSLIKQAADLPEKLTRVERTLVQFARASIANQPLLIIDEPSAGLDSKTFSRLSEFLVRASFSGRSMIILTSEPGTRQIPNSDFYQLKGGGLV